MRVGRIIAALIIAPIVAALLYAGFLAYQVASVPGGPKAGELVFTGVLVAIVGLAFLGFVMLPFANLMKWSAWFRPLVVVVGIVLWFGLSVAGFAAMGQAVDAAVSTGMQGLAIGVPLIIVFAAILGKGSHA